MTLWEIAGEYKKEADRFRGRIRELKQQRKTADPEAIFYLDRRIAVMTAAQREMREISNHLAHYYERGYTRNEKYKL